LAGGTIKKIFNILNTALSDAEKMQLVIRNEAKFVEKPKQKKKDMTVWDVKDVKQFLEHVGTSGTRFYIIFHLALATGMRQLLNKGLITIFFTVI
jgi:integrase